ncbi:MAG: 30S ribosomal protein S20 [Clostridia bacterium]
MPNIKSAKKRVKVIETKTARNKADKRLYKDAVKNLEVAIQENSDNKNELLSKATSLINKASSKNIIPKNTASRKISLLAKKVN